MPALNIVIPIEDGISVFNYSKEKEGWFVRKWFKAERRYRIKKIDGANSQAEALSNFYKVLVEFNDKPNKPHKKQLNPQHERTIREEVSTFIKDEERRVEAGFKATNAHSRRKHSMVPMLDYLDKMGVIYPSQITENTLVDYPLHRSNVMPNTIKTELKDVSVFFKHHLWRYKLISNEVGNSPYLIPKVKITDEMLDANPSITHNDYNLINNHLRTEFLKVPTNKGIYTRRMFYTFIHILKNSGLRPSELLAVRFKDVSITNPKRWSESKQEWEDDLKVSLFIRKSKTGKKRDVLCRSNAGSHLYEFIKFQANYIRNFHDFNITPEMEVFAKPEDKMEKRVAYTYFNHLWRDEVIAPLQDKLEMNRFSEKPYTIYSLRSTFIENCVEANLDVYLVAKLCGNSVGIIQRYYDRSDVLKRASEVQAINYGNKKRPPIETININNL